MIDLASAVGMILARRQEVPRERSALVAITGIDGSGKGYVTGQMAAMLHEQAVRVAAINIDGWLTLPSRRFNPDDPGRHFYGHAIRFDEMFTQLILPLRAKRSHRLAAEVADATDAEVYRPYIYAFADIDVILLEGVFLLKRPYRGHFDLSFWVDCTYETALERALTRGQEGLPPDETIRDYQTIYFPAQRIHRQEDDPRAFATAVLHNDPRLPAAAR